MGGFGPENQPAARSYVGDVEDEFQRSFGQVMPVLAASNIPKVSSTTGNVAASCGISMTNGQRGNISIFPAANVTTGGSVAITFPSTPPSLFFSADGDIGQVTQATVGNIVTVSWAASKMIGGRSQPYNIAYEWSNSQ